MKRFCRPARVVLELSLLLMLIVPVCAGPTSLSADDAAPGGVIDSWLTFLGSESGDYAYGVAADDEGNLFVTGSSYEWDETPVRAYGGNGDAFVARLDPDGDLVWLTYLGGTGGDGGRGIALGADGDIYVVGGSGAGWAETPVRAFTDGVSDHDCFVARLNPDGTLEWHTFLGGGGVDSGMGIALDSDHVHVTGMSEYYGWTETPERAFSSGRDAFVAQLDLDGALQWHTFLGADENDEGNDVAVDDGGCVYVVGTGRSGWTESPVRAYSAYLDAFVAALDSGGDLQWHTFLGSDVEDADEDRGRGIAVADGNVFVAGYGEASWGTDPVRAHSGNYDAFAAMLDSGDGSLGWHTFLGGSAGQEAYDIGLDDSGNLYLAGRSWESWGEPEREFGGDLDGMVVSLDGEGNLLWHTFVGGGYQEQCYAIAASGGAINVAGECNGAWGSPERPFAGGSEAFVQQISVEQAVDVELSAGWNMVSVPVEAADMSVDAIFPDAEAVYWWNPATKSYTVPTTIEPEKSYWVAMTSADTVTVSGTLVAEWTDELAAGWNMAGSVYGDPVDVADLSDDPSGSVQTNAIYHWNPGTKSYDMATQIEQGLGYWMAATQSCELTMTASGA